MFPPKGVKVPRYWREILECREILWWDTGWDTEPVTYWSREILEPWDTGPWDTGPVRYRTRGIPDPWDTSPALRFAPQRICTKQFSNCFAKKLRGIATPVGVYMPPSTPPIGPEVLTFECTPIICRNVWGVGPNSSIDFTLSIRTYIFFSYTAVMSATLASRIVEPAWILHVKDNVGH